MGYRLLRLDGQAIEVHVSGPEDAASLLVFHVGSPSAAVGYPRLTEAAARRGLRTVSYSRPGYGRSERIPGRRVADEAARSAALADRLGHRTFVTLGWSGGGPPALACAALLPDRVRACVVMASPAPLQEVGAQWREWHSLDAVAELETLQTDRREALGPEFEAAAAAFARMTPHRLARGVASAEERETLLGDAGIGGPLTRSMRRAVSRGPWGWFDDNVAQATDWGFRVADIRVPVAVLHGARDALVDQRQGRWLAAAIPNAVGEFPADRGHGSIANPLERVVEVLASLAR